MVQVWPRLLQKQKINNNLGRRDAKTWEYGIWENICKERVGRDFIITTFFFLI